MKCAIKYKNELKLKKEVLQKINRVRLYKCIILPFELVGIDGGCHYYQYEEEASSIHWKLFEEQSRINKLSRADFNT